MAASAAPVKTPDDLFTQELIVGGVGAGSSTSILPTVLNRVLGTKFRLIEGYRGAQDIVLAIERGEVQGACASLGQFRNHEQLFREGKLRILFRAEEAADAGDPGRCRRSSTTPRPPSNGSSCGLFSPAPSSAGPTCSRRTCRRTAWSSCARPSADAVNDPELVAEASRIKLDMSYRPPDHLERLVANLYETPPALIETIKKIAPNLR